MQWVDQQVVGVIIEGGLDYYGVFGYGLGIVEVVGSIGRVDQEDQFVGLVQCQVGNGGVVVVEGFELFDEDEIVEFYENFLCCCGSRGFVFWFVVDVMLMVGLVKFVGLLFVECCRFLFGLWWCFQVLRSCCVILVFMWWMVCLGVRWWWISIVIWL